ncbi:TldD/PmbA family protein [Thermoactinomyces daqus]|jgi:PmbA/TldA metallopeptidase C-terminal domain|uniref:TldD/PmbA family protein n=1 Tax=Thermoactinomyces daqus TaxID=1329516 RepID=A0A7W1X8L5_9BACL|nr:TldD/PmbA family protein [Thermoactinomyces daqus]MBA4542095.1 TldD/PmbA family protein [Thermoactinomyces daqus]
MRREEPGTLRGSAANHWRFYRTVYFESQTKRITRLQSDPRQGYQGLKSFAWLEEKLTSCAEALDVSLRSVRKRIEYYRITIRSQQSLLWHMERPHFSPREIGVLIHLFVRGRSASIPVIWQSTCVEEWNLNLNRAIHEDILPEIEAAVVGEALKEAVKLPLLLDPWLASQLIHECIGHSSEADNYLDYMLPHGYRLGYQWTRYPLDVYDDPTLPGHRASYEMDHEGERARRVQLVKQGIWNDLLHNRETQKRCQAPGAGHGRRTPDGEKTLPRMSVTYADQGNWTFKQLVEGIEHGIYCIGTWGGGSLGLNFIIRPAYGRIIRNGRLTDEIVRRFDIKGNKMDVMMKVEKLSNELRFYNPVFGCDKNGQNNLPVTLGSPHILLQPFTIHPVS